MKIKNIMRLVLAVSFITSNQSNVKLFAQEDGSGLPSRDQIEEQNKWNLTDVYKSVEDWQKDFDFVNSNKAKYSQFEGRIGNSAKDLLACLKFDDEMGIKISRLFLYAMLSKDLDLANSENNARYNQIVALNSEVAAASSFVRPEILSIPEETLKKYLSEIDELKVYEHQLNNLLRTKEHTLSKELEEMLAMTGPVTQVPYDAFSVFKNAEMGFPKVKDENNEGEIQVSDGRYYAAMYSTDREYRERVYKGYYEPFMKYKNTFLTLFTGNLKAIGLNAKARKYKTSREAALDRNNIPLSVYDNLVNTVEANLEPLNRWCSLKKKILGVEKMHAYDTYVTLFPSVKKEYTYDESKDILLEALKPLGKDYLKNLQTAFDNRWIDVYETKGKRSGAYSSGTTFGVHPYVLLNWNDQLNDVFTFAHEMGHNMHSYYTGETQPYPYADYSIFVAEVASTMNEAFLLDYLIENAETKEEKLALIEKHLNNITTTFYRQTRFAAFEQMAHEMYEKGEAITPEILCEKFGKSYQDYWGEDMVVDEEETYTWVRIPHFYYDFYVYQYATSYAASAALTEKIKTEGQPAIDKFMNFLKAGSSKYPIDVLKDAGVDMNTKEPIAAVVNKMNSLLDQMEELLAE
ncbi:MAG: oligoendopeptidase F [Ignavibacteria bacterium]